MVLLKTGPYEGRVAVIAEIIDHNRVRSFDFLESRRNRLRYFEQAIIDGPTTGVPRQSFPYRHLILTPLKLTKLPRGAGTGAVKKLIESEAIIQKWEKSSWAQKRAAVEARRSLNDFGRFKVMIAKKQRADRVHKALHAAKKA